MGIDLDCAQTAYMPRYQTDMQQWLPTVRRRSRLLVTIVSVMWPTIFKGGKWLILWIQSPIPLDVIYTGKNTLFVTEKDVICNRKERYNSWKWRGNNVVTYA